jgi:hypothetical protein
MIKSIRAILPILPLLVQIVINFDHLEPSQLGPSHPKLDQLPQTATKAVTPAIGAIGLTVVAGGKVNLETRDFSPHLTTKTLHAHQSWLYPLLSIRSTVSRNMHTGHGLAKSNRGRRINIKHGDFTSAKQLSGNRD